MWESSSTVAAKMFHNFCYSRAELGGIYFVSSLSPFLNSLRFELQRRVQNNALRSNLRTKRKTFFLKCINSIIYHFAAADRLVTIETQKLDHSCILVCTTLTSDNWLNVA